MDAAAPNPPLAAEPNLIITGECPVQVWGLDGNTRHRRLFGSWKGEGTILVAAEWVFDTALAKELMARPGAALLIEPEAGAGLYLAAAHAPARMTGTDISKRVGSAMDAAAAREAGLTPVSLDEIFNAYDPVLRKRRVPFARSLHFTPISDIERRLYNGAYKGVTDLVTKYVWPRPARWVTRLCAVRGVTPNAVTTLGLLLTIAAFFFFWNSHFAAGLVCAWLMTFLDTVDGKLARVTLTSSKWGDHFDHGIDLISPPFWYWAWWVGLSDVAANTSAMDWALGVTLAGYVLGRGIEGAFKLIGRFHIHIWKQIDSRFRLVTTRRNPNLIILTLCACTFRPDLGLLIVGVWTAVSVAFHLVRLLMALFVRARGGVLTSWLAEDGTG